MEPIEWLGSESAKEFPLHLISNQPSTRLHSQLDSGGISKGSKIKDREPMVMHPDDAEKEFKPAMLLEFTIKEVAA